MVAICQCIAFTVLVQWGGGLRGSARGGVRRTVSMEAVGRGGGTPCRLRRVVLRLLPAGWGGPGSSDTRIANRGRWDCHLPSPANDPS